MKKYYAIIAIMLLAVLPTLAEDDYDVHLLQLEKQMERSERVARMAEVKLKDAWPTASS